MYQSHTNLRSLAEICKIFLLISACSIRNGTTSWFLSSNQYIIERAITTLDFKKYLKNSLHCSAMAIVRAYSKWHCLSSDPKNIEHEKDARTPVSDIVGKIYRKNILSIEKLQDKKVLVIGRSNNILHNYMLIRVWISFVQSNLNIIELWTIKTDCVNLI